jgi:hypothetical protein
VKKLLVSGLCGFVTLLLAVPATAQATRTWVSGVGDDANPCSRTAPCRTFAGAISKTATGGYIDVLDAGAFGAVTITKAITIDGSQGSHAGILATFTTGIVVNAPGETVILRNLSIEGAGSGTHGIRVIAAGQVHIENCTIQNFVNNGVVFSAVGGRLFVQDTSVKSISDQGFYIQEGRAMLERVAAQGNGFGVLVGPAASATVKQSTASGNQVGFGTAYSGGAQLNLEDSVTTNNEYGVMALHGSSVRMSNVHVSNNSVIGLSNDGTAIIATFGNNRFTGNAANGNFTSTIILR